MKIQLQIFHILLTIARRVSISFILVIAISNIALANAAVGSPGFYGAELVVSDKLASKKLIVDEKVIIDLRKWKVNVKYEIVNPTTSPMDYNMVFPINDQRTSGNEVLPYSKDLGFFVRLNGKQLAIRELDILDVKLDGSYRKLSRIVSTCFAFPVKLKPGKNILTVNYDLMTSYSWMGDRGGNRYYKYSIWTAKNWVSKFRKAVWRVYFPDPAPHAMIKTFFSGYLKHHDGDWYTSGDDRRVSNFYKKELLIKAPGKRADHANYADFFAYDYAPEGEIEVYLKMKRIEALIKGCDNEDLKNCWKDALKSILSVRPFMGDRRCYSNMDLDLIMIKGYINEMVFAEDSVPYVRNEIYARKGYSFNSDRFKTFFNSMPWYKSNSKNVVLNDIEKWNVSFLKQVEKDPSNRDNIYHNSENSMPEQCK